MADFTRRKVDFVPPAIAAKWSEDVLDEGFLPFPKRLLRCLPSLFTDVRDLQAVLAVIDYRRLNLSRPPSYNFLAFTAGMEVPEFKDRIAKLEKKGMLVVTGIDDAISISIDGLLDQIRKLTGLLPANPSALSEEVPF